MPVEAISVVAQEDRSLTTFSDREVDGAGGAERERNDHGLATVADDPQRAVPWSWFNPGLALHAATLDAHVTRTLVDISLYFGPILTVADVLLAGAIRLAAWRGDGGLPRWLAYFSSVFVLEQAIETITIHAKSGFTAPGGDMNF